MQFNIDKKKSRSFILLYIYTCTCIALYKRGLRINIFLEFPLLKKVAWFTYNKSDMLIYTFSNSIKKNVRKEILNSIEKKNCD